MKGIMDKILASLALTAVGFTAQAGIGIASGPIVNPANGHRYYLVGQGIWTETEAFARTLGGHLVTFNDAAENAWVRSNFLAPNPALNPWMGLQDADNNGTWEWISGESVTYTNWAPGEPNFPHERHSNLFPENHAWAGQWNSAPDIVEAGVRYGIVEVGEPPTVGVKYFVLALLAVLALGLAYYTGWAMGRRRPAGS